MIQVSTGMVQGYRDIGVPYSLLSKTDESKGLLIMFPGGGYTVQAPILHYSTGLFLNNSFDVLQVNYQYHSDAYASFSMQDIVEAIKFDARTVIDKVLADNQDKYDNYFLIGKSIGTIAMSSEINRYIFKDAKAIWLTPLLTEDEVLLTMVQSKNKGISFMGDKDRFYKEELYNEVKGNPFIDFKLIPDLNHSLEYDGNAVESIDILKHILSEIEKFI